MIVEFDGIDTLIREVEQIETMSEQIKNRALIRGGEVLLERMKEEVYARGLQRRTGQAIESLTRTDPKDDELYVGTEGGKKQPGFYLYMHEFGYYNVRAKRFIAPKPFASIAYELSKGDILDAYADELRKGLGMT